MVAGSTLSGNGDVTDSKGGDDAWIVKLSAAGTKQWQKALGGSGSDVAVSVQQTFDSGYIVAGSTTSGDGDVTLQHGARDFWVVKLSDTGGIQWQKTFGGTKEDGALWVRQTPDSGYIVAGYALSNDGDVTGNHGSYDYWILKLSATGNIVWQKTFGGTANDYAVSVQVAGSGYIVAGYSNSADGDVTGNHGGEDFWVVKLSGTGGGIL